MEKFDEILNQLKDASGHLKANLHILEEIVPIEEQMNYFEYSKQIRSDEASIVNRNYLIAKLFSPDCPLDEKRKSLVILASLVNVAAYRAIETYKCSPLEPELANWAAMALAESRILLDSEFSGEKQFFISTGLGGHNGKLRFFCIVPSQDRSAFTELQRNIIEREFTFQFMHEKVDVEQFVVRTNYTRMLLLYDIKGDIRSVVQKAIKECNEFGDFLDIRFLLTNIKQFDDDEILKLLNTHKTTS